MIHLHLPSLAALLFVSRAFADPTTSASGPASTACGDIVNNGSFFYDASIVYECLTSVPFNPAVATRFLAYYNDTLQFQSTLSYLKSPPSSYQQPATDLIAGLGQIQQDVDNGLFPDQYSFEASLLNLLYSSHDAHVQLVAGALAPFTFSSPYEIASVSIDGTQLPKVYITEDLFANQTGGLDWAPSAISTINGQDVVDYLTQFAAVNSIGGLEPHTDWNMLMQSAALDIQGTYETFAGGATFFPGDTITFNFENGSSTGPLPYVGIYNYPDDTGPLETGGDFYNFFVLGFYPQAYFDEQEAEAVSFAAASSTVPPAAVSSVQSVGAEIIAVGGYATSSPTQSATPTGWGNSAYPDFPDVVQQDLATDGGGFVTGYFLNQTSVAVLSIPSFREYGDAVGTFSDTVNQFITRGVQAGLNKVVIDLQQNSGGDEFLAIDTFKRFFPTINPFGGSRRRAHPLADVLGNSITNYWETLPVNNDTYNDLSVDEWVIVDRLNAATGQNFTSWADYFGPEGAYGGDGYTSTERYNLSSAIFDVQASGGIVVSGFGNAAITYSQPWAAEDIIILTDGLCSSSCAVFMEMMHHDAGVRTVVVGGRPSYGPMQSPGQSRGARMYSVDVLDEDIGFAQGVDDAVLPPVLPNRTINQDVYITFASVNLRDQIRPNGTVPLQFLYEAADCRIFYTPQTWYNYSVLWQYAADAIWTNPKLCVQGSTGYSTTANGTSPINAPPSTDPKVNVTSNITGIITLSGTSNEFPTNLGGSGEIVDSGNDPASFVGTPCKNLRCPGQLTCHNVTICNNGNQVPALQCRNGCSSTQMSCRGGLQCQLYGISTKKGPNGKSFWNGVCAPVVPKSCTTASSSVTFDDEVEDD